MGTLAPAPARLASCASFHVDPREPLIQHCILSSTKDSSLRVSLFRMRSCHEQDHTFHYIFQTKCPEDLHHLKVRGSISFLSGLFWDECGHNGTDLQAAAFQGSPEIATLLPRNETEINALWSFSSRAQVNADGSAATLLLNTA